MLTILMLALIGQDPIKSRLDKAKLDYETTTYDLKKQALTRFDAAEDRAVKMGNTKVVTLVNREKASLERGEPWDFKSIDARDLKPKHEAAYKQWKSVLAEVSTAYTLKRKRTEAEAVQKTLDDLNKAEAEREANKPYAALQPGSVWTGTKRVKHRDNPESVNFFELTIEERNGDQFWGRTLTNKDNRHQIAGSIHEGKIHWEVVKASDPVRKGQPQTGMIDGDTLRMTFLWEPGDGVTTKGQTVLELRK